MLQQIHAISQSKRRSLRKDSNRLASLRSAQRSYFEFKHVTNEISYLKRTNSLIIGAIIGHETRVQATSAILLLASPGLEIDAVQGLLILQEC